MATHRANQLVEAGLCLQLAGDLTGAVKVWEEALRLDPGNVRAKRCLQALNEKAIAPAAAQANDVRISALSEPLGGGRGAAYATSQRANPFEPPPQVAGSTLTPGPFALLDGDSGSPAPSSMPAPTPKPPPSKRPNPFERPPAPANSSSSYEALLRSAAADPFSRPPATETKQAGGRAPDAHESYQALLASAAGPAGDRAVQPIQLTRQVEAANRLEAVMQAGAPVEEAPPALSAQVDVLLQGARDLLDLDDHTGAHDTIEKILAIDPENADARELLRRNEATLLAMYDSKIGDLAHRPTVKLRADEIVWLNIDNRAGFLLSMIDGTVSYDDLFALSSMSRLDTARIICQLLGENVIG